MNIQITLYELLDALNRNDRTDVNNQLEIMIHWKLKGRCLPAVEKIENDNSAFVVRRKAELTEEEETDKAESLTQLWIGEKEYALNDQYAISNMQ